MKCINKFSSLLFFSLLCFLCISLIPSCSRHSPPDPSDYVGNWDGKDWKGYQSGSLIVNEIKDNMVCIVSSDSYYANNLVMPNKIKLSDGQIKKLTKIGKDVFKDNINITGHITLPSVLKEIDDYAFSGCHELIGKLIIPNSMQTIGNQAFSGCSGFTDGLTIPNSVTTIGPSCFFYCGIIVLALPNNLINIGSSAFSNCHSLREIYLYKRIIFHGNAFSSDSLLRTIHLGEMSSEPQWECSYSKRSNFGELPYININVSGTWKDKIEVLRYMDDWGTRVNTWRVNGE